MTSFSPPHHHPQQLSPMLTTMEAQRVALRAPTPPDYLVNANERQYLAKICWLLHDGATHALRVTFDSVHPPLYLRQHLAQQQVRSVLRRLLEQKVKYRKRVTEFPEDTV